MDNQNEKCFLSILIPVYNKADYLDDCFKSILAQSFTNYEVIAVDDGSTDNSWDIMSKYSDEYPNVIKIKRIEHGGVINARINAFQMSYGTYIYMMDADDYLCDFTFFEKAYEKILKFGLDLLLFGIKTDTGKEFTLNFPQNSVLGRDDINEMWKMLISTDKMNSMSTKILKRELIDYEIRPEYKQITNSADLFFSIPVIFESKSILYVDICPICYRTVNNTRSITHTFNPNIFFSMKTTFGMLKQCVNKYMIVDEEIEKLYAQRIMRIVFACYYKQRYSAHRSFNDIYDFNKILGEDSDFRKYYSNVRAYRGPLFAKLILHLLYYRKYRLVSMPIVVLSYFCSVIAGKNNAS